MSISVEDGGEDRIWNFIFWRLPILARSLMRVV